MYIEIQWTWARPKQVRFRIGKVEILISSELITTEIRPNSFLPHKLAKLEEKCQDQQQAIIKPVLASIKWAGSNIGCQNNNTNKLNVLFEFNKFSACIMSWLRFLGAIIFKICSAHACGVAITPFAFIFAISPSRQTLNKLKSWLKWANFPHKTGDRNRK